MDPKVENECVEEYGGLGWGKTLPVPSVQENMKNDSQSMPERYIQEQKDRALDSEFSPASSEIPIIKFSLLASGDEDELRKLDSSCKEWGFFQRTSYGIAVMVLKDMKATVAAFFELPLDEKMKYEMAANDLQGYGQGYVVSEQQKLYWCDLIFLMTSPPKIRKLKPWPAIIPGFKDTVTQYSEEIQRVPDKVLTKLSLLMVMDKDGLKMLHGEMEQAMRMTYYPSCSMPDLVLGVSPHSDACTITFLLQDDEITALQIKHKDKWVPVEPTPDALLVNTGNVAKVWSNALYRSIGYRAVTNENARISVATVVLPKEEAEIGPVESMVNDDRPRVYGQIMFMDYLRHNLARRMDGNAH